MCDVLSKSSYVEQEKFHRRVYFDDVPGKGTVRVSINFYALFIILALKYWRILFTIFILVDFDQFIIFFIVNININRYFFYWRCFDGVADIDWLLSQINKLRCVPWDERKTIVFVESYSKCGEHDSIFLTIISFPMVIKQHDILLELINIINSHEKVNQFDCSSRERKIEMTMDCFVFRQMFFSSKTIHFG